MAKLKKMPNMAIVDGFKGDIDFYVYMGIPCARKWPVYKPRVPYESERLNQEDFAAINKAAGSLPVEIIDAYFQMAVSTPFTWKDLLVRSYMRGLWF